MTSIIKLQVFSGAKDEGPLCYLLQVDGDYILLDCGWDERFDLRYFDELRPFIPKISAVLISHPDPLHLGGLPYLVAKCGLTAPVYATVPVYKMGQMFIYDMVYSHLDVEEFDHYSLDDVDMAFEKVEQVKYNQTVVLKGDSGVHFTALPAGHMIGGSIWRICRVTGEDIIYCVDFNHKKERHLNGCSFDNFNRPHLLITGAHHISLPQMRRKDRDEQLVTKILRTVRQKGDCMIVIDTAGRVLELAHLLDQLWSNADAGLSTYNLVMMSHVASSVVQFAKSQLEWMNEKLFKYDSNSARYNPFTLKHVTLCHSHQELMRVRSPKVVLCSSQDMESGFSRELFLDWCADPRNGVILTGRPSSFTLAAKLVNLAERANDGVLSVADRLLSLLVKKRVPLEGEELFEYKRRKAERDAEETRLRMERARRQAQAAESDDSDDDDLPAPIVPRHSEKDFRSFDGSENDAHCFDIMAKWDNQQKMSFFKTTKKSFPMFPYTEEKVKWDDYGEVIKPEDYTVISKIDLRKGAGQQTNKEPVVVKKREEEEEVYNPNEHVEEMPTKCVEFKNRIEVVCRVEFIEYEGISDGESTKKLLAGLMPRQIIIVHGSMQDTRDLYAYFVDAGVAQGKIEAPANGQLVDASVESFIFQVALSDALLAELHFRDVSDGNSLAWIDARVMEKEAIDNMLITGTSHLMISDGNEQEADVIDNVEPMETDEAENEKENENENENENGDEQNGEKEGGEDEMVENGVAKKPKESMRGNLVLENLPKNQIPIHQSVFVNDPKLSDFKNILSERGYRAEFLSGTLLINGGTCSIRRSDTGFFQMEGAFNKDYYKLRHLFYDQFAVL
uniref:Cleavage and polyadenylation specificity factor subunit 2 n=1 Tax=Caenorhabditis japonica TaxID=281687 RepID=A0A8R1DV18_CAEJA